MGNYHRYLDGCNLIDLSLVHDVHELVLDFCNTKMSESSDQRVLVVDEPTAILGGLCFLTYHNLMFFEQGRK